MDKAGNTEDLGNEKLQLICKLYDKKLLPTQRVVSGINSMNDNKLKILCKYYKKFSPKGIEALLSNKEIVDNINGYDDEIFKSILDCASSELNILEILKGREVCNTNNEFESSDSKEDKDLGDSFDCEESDEEMAMSSKSQSDSKEDKSYSYLHGKEMETSSENQNDCEEIVKQQSFINWQFLYDNFSPEEITELLENQDDKRLELCKKIASSDLTKLEIYRLIVRQFFINDEKLQHILKKFSSEEIIEILKDQTAVVNITHYNDEELEHVFNICVSLTIQDTIKVLNITPKKLRLICNKCNFSDTRTLLENQKVVKHLSFIDDQTFTVICNSKYSNQSTSIDNKIIKLLEKKKIVENICSIGYEKLTLFMLNNDENRRFSLNDVIKLLENQEIVNNIITYEIEKLKYVLDICNFLIKDVTKVLSIDHKNLRLIFEKFSPSDIKALLENQAVVVNITDYNNEELGHVFNICGSFAIQNTIKVLSINPKKLRLIRNKFSSSDIQTLLENQKIVESINSITLLQLEIICNNDKFSFSDIKRLLENQKIVNNIIDYKIQELELVFYSYELSPQNIIKPEKLRLIFERFSPRNTHTLLENQKIVKGIGSSTPRELERIFKKFSLQDIITLLENIAPEKSELIFEKFSLQDMIEVLEDQNAVKGINSVTTKELKAITDNVTGKVFVSIFKNFEPSVKSTLRFVIPLFRAGRVRDINIDYLNNKNSVYNDIIEHLKHFYPNLDIMSLVAFPIFEKNITCEEPVSKLYNLSLEQVIESVNPHKRARYS